MDNAQYDNLKEAILLGKATVNLNYLPSNSVVFSIMFHNKDLTEWVIHTVTEEKVELVEPLVEYRNDMQKVTDSSVWFDVFIKSVDERIFTLDMNRQYFKSRNRNRKVYYGAKALADQTVKEGRYEHLKQVLITFIYEDNTTATSPPLAKIQLHDTNTKELYTELFTLYEINLNKITNEASEINEDLVMLKNFLSIKSQEELCNFIITYDSPMARRLTVEYIKAVKNEKLLLEIGGSDRFMWKLTEERLLEERREGKAEGKAEGIAVGIAEGKAKAAEYMLNLIMQGVDPAEAARRVKENAQELSMA